MIMTFSGKIYTFRAGDIDFILNLPANRLNFNPRIR